MHTHFSPYDQLRPITEITSLIKDLMMARYRSLDYSYRNHDRRMTGRLDKDQLRIILRECGLELNIKETEKLWSTFALAPDGLYTWSKFCQRYSSDDTKLKQAGEAEDHRLERSLTSAEGFNAAHAHRSLLTRGSTTRSSTRSRVSDPILNNLQPAINANYSKMESLYKDLDKRGRGSVTTEEAVGPFMVLKIKIEPRDLEHVLRLFDLENTYRFHYQIFLSTLKYKPRLATSQSSTKPGLSKPSSRMLNNKIVRQLRGRAPELRRQCKKSDPLGQGFLSLRDFRLCLDMLGVRVAEDDSFSEVKSLFDHTLHGQINYEEFASLCK